MALGALRARLHRLTAPRGRYVVFYDAACALCRRTRRWLERVELGAPITFIDVNDRVAMARWPSIDVHRAQHEVLVIDPKGRRWAGYDAAWRLIRAAHPVLQPVDALLQSPQARWLGWHAYHWVSSRRYQLSRLLPHNRHLQEAPARRSSDRRRSIPMAKHEETHHRRQVNPLKGAVAGMIGGLVASWCMEQAQVWARDIAQRRRAEHADSGDGQVNRAAEQRTDEQQSQEQKQSSEPATVKAAEAVSQRMFDRSLADPIKPAAGEAMHYGFGAAVGALYGALAELIPAITARNGLAYGTAVWAVADEIAVPAAGLAAPPQQQPARTHAYALGSHLVFGVTLEIVRRAVRWLLR